MYGASGRVGGGIRRVSSGGRAASRAVRRGTYTASTASSRLNAKRDEIEEYIRDVRNQGLALKLAANNLRNNLAPEIQGYTDEFRSYISFIDSVVKAWGLTTGDWRDHGYHLSSRPSRIGGTSTAYILRSVRRVKGVFGILADWGLFPDLRGEVHDVFLQLVPLSEALWELNGAFMDVFNGAIDLYDLGDEVANAGTRWTSMPLTNAAGEICKNYLPHSNWRRLRRSRSPGKHAAWDEVCDRWENPSTGDYVYWSRPDDPMHFGPMGSRLRRGKEIVEPGCLPGEVCENRFISGYQVPTFDAGPALVSSIRTGMDTPVVDNVLIEARELLKEVRDVVNEVIAHLKGIRDGWGWNILPSSVSSYAKRELNRVITSMRAIRSDINAQRSQLNEYKTYWRSGSWRTPATTSLNTASFYADNIEALRRSGISAACNFVYPKASLSSSALYSYWRGQGVGRSCAETRGRPYISWMPDVRFVPEEESTRGGSLPGLGPGRAIETLGFGSIETEPKKNGLPTWGKALLAGGIFWLVMGHK